MDDEFIDWSVESWTPAPRTIPSRIRTLPSPSQYRDPALQPGFRVKTGDELSGYTRETPGQESARLAGEYNRAGSNNPEAYGYSSVAIPSSIPMVGGFKPFQFLQQSAAGIAQGGIEGIVGTVGGVTDTLTRISDNVAGTDFGSPVNSALIAYERRMQEMGEGNASWFFRNVAKSITKVVAAAPTGGVGIAANLFLEPAHQSYMRGRESGMSPKVALGYGVLHGATEAVANALVERVIPGTSSMVTGLLSSAVADDVAKVAVPGIVNALMKTGQASFSEGAEEGAAFGIGWAIDESFRLASGVAAGKQYNDVREFAWDFAKSVGMGFAAGGLLAGGLQSVRWDSTAKAIEQLGQQPAQTPPNPTTPEAMNAPQQPTPLTDPTLPLQPTGQSQPAAIDPGQGNPAVGEPTPDPGWRRFSEPGPSAVTQAVPLNEPLSMPNTNMPSVPVEEPIQQPGDDPYFDRAMVAMDRANPEMTYTHSEVTKKPPEVIAKIAAIEDPSRAAFASAMGVKAKDLPKEFGSKAQRSYAIEVARKVQAYAQQQAAPEKTGGVFDVMERLMPGAVRNGSLLPVRDVRAQFPNLSKEQFDKGIRRLSEQGKISLHKHDAPGQLSPQEREQAITDGNGNFYVGMAVRGASGARQELNVWGKGPTQKPMDPAAGQPPVSFAGMPKSVAEKTRMAGDRRENDPMPQTPPVAAVPPRGVNTGRLGPTYVPDSAGGASPSPTAIPLDAPPVQETYENSPARVGNPTGATDVMAQKGGPTGMVSNVRMASNPDAERTSLAEMNRAVQDFAETVNGMKTTAGAGGIRKKGVQGYFDPSQNAIRLRTWGDFPTLVHEVTHSVYRYSEVMRNAPRGVTSEMIALGRKLYPDADVPLAVNEGYAEAVRIMMQDGDQAIADIAPEFAAFFSNRVQQLDPKAFEKFQTVKDLSNRWFRRMGAMERAKAQQINTKGEIGTLWEFLKDARLSAVDWLWGSKAIAPEIDKKVAEFRDAVGLPQLPKSMSAQSAVTRHANVATGVVDTWFTKEQTDPWGAVIGPSMKTILDPVAEKQIQDKFWTLAYARRTIAVADEDNLGALNTWRAHIGEPTLDPRETGLSVSDARQIMSELESDPDWDTLKTAIKKFDQFNVNTLRYMAKVSPDVYAEQVDRILRVDPGAWIPLRREIDLNDKLFRKPGSRGAQPQSGSVSWKLKGSTLPIKSIFESVALETERRISAAHKNALVSRLMDLVIPDEDGFMFPSGLGGYMQVLEAPTKDTYKIVRDGKTYHVLMSDRMQRFLNTMNQADFDSANVVLGTAASILRATTSWVSLFRLALNPRYMLVNRPAMNLLDAAIKVPASVGGKGDVEDAKIAGRAMKKFAVYSANAFMDAATGNMTSDEARFVMDVIERMGLQYNTGLRGSEMKATRLGRMVRAKAVTDERTLVEHLDRMLDWLKIGGRYASDLAESTFMADQMVAVDAWFQKNPEAKARWERNEGLTENQIVSLRETVLDVTGDAADDPLLGKQLSRVGVFLPSTGVRFTKSSLKLWKKSPAVFLKFGMALAVVSFLHELWKLGRDEDYRKWTKQNPREAVRYDLIQLGGRWYYVPVYSELGALFSGIPRGLAMSAYHQDPTMAVKAAAGLITNLFPNLEIPLPEMVRQQYMGTDSFGKPIVSEFSEKPKGYSEPSSPRDRIAEEQYSDDTSGIAKFLAQTPGNIIGRERLDDLSRLLRKNGAGVLAATMDSFRSPMRVEHMLNFWTGGQLTKGKEIASGKRPLIDIGPKTEAQGTLSRPGEMGSEFYATLDRLQKREADKSKPLSKEDEDGLRLLSAANEVMSVQRRLRNKASDRNGEKAVASAMSLVADNAMRDLEARRYDTSAYKIAKRVNEVAEAKIDNEPAKIAEKVANGVAALSMSLPLAVERGKNIKEEQDRRREEWNQAQRFIDAVGMTKKEVYDLAKSHWATQDGGKPKTQRLAIKLGIPQEQR